MRFLFPISWKSILNRRLSFGLCVLSIAVSVSLLLSIERVRKSTRQSFEQTVSGVDLIVGASGSPLQLMLYSVFRVGSPTANMTWSSAQRYTEHPEVKWAIPISLGDSHRGFRVVGTTQEYFEHYRYARSRTLELSEGSWNWGVFDAVLGSEVARRLQYSVGTEVSLTHGIGEAAILSHDDRPFKVIGILQPTGTPVDRSIHVSLEGIEAIHIDWQDGIPPGEDEALGIDEILNKRLHPTQITALLLGLNSRMQIFHLQREVGADPREALMAVLPGVTLQELWGILGNVEATLRLLSFVILLTSFIGMLTAILTGLSERRREISILRAIGLKKRHIFSLLMIESSSLSLLGICLGVVTFYLGAASLSGLVETHVGLFLDLGVLSSNELGIAFVIWVLGSGVGLLPACQAYRYSLSDGLSVRL